MSPLFLFIYLTFGRILGGLLSTAADMVSLAIYPVLLLADTPPIYINAINDAVLTWTGVGSTAFSLKELEGHWRQVGLYSIFTIIGSALDCMLLIQFPGKIFEKIVPFCIAFSGLMILSGGEIHLGNEGDHPNHLVRALSLLCLLITGAYAGYFGAASDVLMLVILNVISGDVFLTVNAMKNTIGALSNLVILIIYMFTEEIYWGTATPLAIGALIGSYFRPRIVRHIPVKIIRLDIVVPAFI